MTEIKARSQNIWKMKRSDYMSITVVRKTNVIGMGSPIHIKLNGKKIKKIEAGEQVEIEMIDTHANLSVSQTGTKSNQLEVRDGDTIEITSTNWAIIVRALPAVAILLVSFISDNTNHVILSAIFAVALVIISTFLFNTYEITKV